MAIHHHLQDFHKKITRPLYKYGTIPLCSTFYNPYLSPPNMKDRTRIPLKMCENIFLKPGASKQQRFYSPFPECTNGDASTFKSSSKLLLTFALYIYNFPT